MKLKKNLIIVGIVVGLIILISGISVYATATYYANQVTYKNGKTVEQALNELYASKNDRLYLYWKGNTYDSVTGGWESSVVYDAWADTDSNHVTRKDATFNSNHIDLATDSIYQYRVANTKNKINCSGYNYINIYYTMTTNYYSRVCLASRIDSGLYGVETLNGSGPSIDIYKSFDVQNELRLLSIPIDSDDSEYIFVSTIRGVARDNLTDLKVYGIFLSKNIDP